MKPLRGSMPRTSNRRAASHTRSSVSAKPTQKRNASRSAAPLRLSDAARTRKSGLTKRLIIALTKSPPFGSKRSIQPPTPLADRPSIQLRRSPPNSTISISVPTGQAANTPIGTARQMNRNFQRSSRNVILSGTSCQRYAPPRNASGMVRMLARTAGTTVSMYGANTSPARKPRTTLGKLAIDSIAGFR